AGHPYLREVHPAIGTCRLGARHRTRTRRCRGTRVRPVRAPRAPGDRRPRELPDTPAQTGRGARPRGMTDVDAILFDLDGTLLDTAPDMVGALNRLLGEN